MKNNIFVKHTNDKSIQLNGLSQEEYTVVTINQINTENITNLPETPSFPPSAD